MDAHSFLPLQWNSCLSWSLSFSLSRQHPKPSTSDTQRMAMFSTLAGSWQRKLIDPTVSSVVLKSGSLWQSFRALTGSVRRRASALEVFSMLAPLTPKPMVVVAFTRTSPWPSRAPFRADKRCSHLPICACLGLVHSHYLSTGTRQLLLPIISSKFKQRTYYFPTDISPSFICAIIHTQARILVERRSFKWRTQGT